MIYITKKCFLKKGVAFLLLVTLAFICGIGTIPVNAAEHMNTNNKSSYMETNKDEAVFVSKNVTTREETFYNIYSNKIAVDISNESDLATLNNGNIESKVDSAYFSATTVENIVSPNSIIGKDERIRINSTTTYPYSAICHLTIMWPDGTSTDGTAWMYWEDIAITAGHCVYSIEHGGWAESIIVRPGANGSYSPYGYVYATTLHTSTKWVDEANWEYDYGVLELSSDIGNSTGWFGTSWTIWWLEGTDVTVTGYSDENYREMWAMSGEVTNSTTRKVYYEIDTVEGQSGAPVYKSDHTVIAIHAYGGTSNNSATRITSGLFDYFHSFREE